MVVLGRMLERRSSQLRACGKTERKRTRDNNEDKGQRGTRISTRTTSMKTTRMRRGRWTMMRGNSLVRTWTKDNDKDEVRQGGRGATTRAQDKGLFRIVGGRV